MQQTLPFKLEGMTAPREVIRSVSKNADHLRKISLSFIRLRPGFNARVKPEWMAEEMWEQTLMIPDLADGIYASNGPADPLQGDIYKMDGLFYASDGERRIRALRHLISTGRENYPDGSLVDEVTILLNPPGTTDLQRKISILNTQNNLPLSVTQKAFYFRSFKEQEKMSSEAIGALFSMSRQTVDNYLTVTELPKETQEKIDSGEIKMTNAIVEYRNSKKPAKKSPVLVDPESGEILDNPPQKEEKPLDGDEDEFKQQDNSITGPGSLGGFKEGGSAAITVTKDSIYMDGQKLALWKQFVHRYEHLKSTLRISDMKDDEVHWEDTLAAHLKNEYNLTVK